MKSLPEIALEYISLDCLHPRAGNRKVGGIPKESLAELAASIKEKGVLQPLIVRPVVMAGSLPQYEIVAGERRSKAAAMAGLATAPCQVRAMSDEEADQVALIDNMHRADLHPLDEAVGYATIYNQVINIEDLDAGIEAVATKVGKPVRYVVQRMQLNQLVESARALWRKNEHMTLGHALLICKLPAHVQDRLIKALTGHDGWALDRGFRAFQDYVQREIYMELSRAPWKKDDAGLLPGAGSCVACTKRTGANSQLFPEVGKRDTCLDSGCYQKKLAAHMARVRLELQDRPHMVVSTNFHDGPKGSLNQYEWEPAKKGDAKAVECLVVDGENAGHVVYGVKRNRSEGGRAILTDAEKAKRKREQAERAIDRSVTAAIVEQTIEAIVENKNLPDVFLRKVAHFAFEHCNQEGLGAYLGWKKEKKSSHSYTSMSWDPVAAEWIAIMPTAELMRFPLLCILSRAMGKDPFLTDDVLDLATLAGVDRKATEREVRDAAAKAAAAKKAAKPKKPAGPKLTNTSADGIRMAKEREERKAAKATAKKG